ncbi:MAG: hypothetical protein IT342_01255 [Candidatus Melainabacteria bacterium]|nr:hypothetical protein [Candidatus Melainabacteria bacterium]
MNHNRIINSPTNLDASNEHFVIARVSTARSNEGRLLSWAKDLAQAHEIPQPCIQITPLERALYAQNRQEYLYLVTITRG